MSYTSLIELSLILEGAGGIRVSIPKSYLRQQCASTVLQQYATTVSVSRVIAVSVTPKKQISRPRQLYQLRISARAQRRGRKGEGAKAQTKTLTCSRRPSKTELASTSPWRTAAATPRDWQASSSFITSPSGAPDNRRLPFFMFSSPALCAS